MSESNPIEAILQHYHDDTQQYFDKSPEAVSMAQAYLAYAALDLGYVLKTDPILAEILETRLADMAVKLMPNDLVDPEYTCSACGRPEANCSADPCATVIRQREE
jgi:hypothetical protein